MCESLLGFVHLKSARNGDGDSALKEGDKTGKNKSTSKTSYNKSTTHWELIFLKLGLRDNRKRRPCVNFASSYTKTVAGCVFRIVDYDIKICFFSSFNVNIIIIRD